MKNLLLSVTFIATAAQVILGTVQPAAAAILNWDWNYSGNSIASGTFTTNDIPDAAGFYLITGITGTRNGETITGLQTAGTAIPGNEPFAVDNLISLNPQQLTGEGFGFSTSGGKFVNPFFADFLTTPGYLEFASTPLTPTGFATSELPVSFSARITNVPEPFTVIGTFVGGAAALRLRKKLKLVNK